MAQYDVFAHPSGGGYLLDVQTNFLEGLDTRIVVPLMRPAEAPTRSRQLNPTLRVDGRDVVMVTQYLTAVTRSELRLPHSSLESARDQITRALDRLLHDF